MHYITELQNHLATLGYDYYSDILTPYTHKHQDSLFRIVFAGDDLVGKSTVINALLGRKIAPTGSIHHDCRLSITPASSDAVLINAGTREDISRVKVLSRENSSLTLETDIAFLKNNSLEFAELPGLLCSGMNGVIECLNYDAVVLVLDAEKLFSKLERIFLNMCVKFIGPERITVIVNKSEAVDKAERDELADVLRTKISGISQDIGLVFTDSDSWPEKARKRLIAVSSVRASMPVQNMKEYIASRLDEDAEKLRKDAESKRTFTVNTHNTAHSLLSESDDARTEFARRQNMTIEAIAGDIRSGFEEVKRSTLAKYRNGGQEWYSEQCAEYISDASCRIAEQAAEKAASRLQDDVKCLTSVLGSSVATPEIDSPEVSEGFSAESRRRSQGNYSKIATYGGSICGVLIGGLVSRASLVAGIISGLALTDKQQFIHSFRG